MGIRLVITQDNKLVADVRNYEGPVPRVGDSVHDPHGTEPVPGMFSDGTMIVRHVGWGIVGHGAGLPHLTGAAEPFVEVVV